MSTARRRLPFGAELLDGGRTRFRLWAPDANRVAVLREGEAPLDMAALADGWHEAVCSAPAGTRYRYRIDDALEVPDPASRAQDGGVDGPSIVVDPTAYAWQQPLWRGRRWEEAVIYELHVGLYGGFSGVARELADLAALGVTAIELMPIGQFPGTRNWGYDGVLPFAPAASYGTPDELKALIDAAHAHHLMVFLDVVYNHFGPHGNYLPQYASAFFDPARQTPWGAAIAFAQPEVREFFLENALYWVHEYRFDGLRIDAAHAIGDDAFLRELAARVGAHHDGECHRHVILENEENDAALLEDSCTAQWNDDAHHVLHVLLTGENAGYYGDYTADTGAALARWLGEGFVFQGQPMDYRGGSPRGVASAHLPPTAFVNALQNHDQVGNRAYGDRLAAAVTEDALLAAQALLLLCPQIPMLFMGEDWASRDPFQFFTDYEGDLADAVRNGRRSEFARFREFSGDDIPDPNALATFEASRPDFDRRTNPFREKIRALIALRHAVVVPRLSGARALAAVPLGPTAVDARWRMGDGSELRIVANLGATAVAYPGAAPADDPAPFYCSLDAPPHSQLPPHACIAWVLEASA